MDKKLFKIDSCGGDFRQFRAEALIKRPNAAKKYQAKAFQANTF
jgi:hypothetical protein